MPFSFYNTTDAASSYGFTTTVNGVSISSCPSGASVRSCFQTILGQLDAQGVTGVRIIVPFCDSTSLAFTNCGSSYTAVSWNPSGNPAQQTWITNVTNFFADVHTAGIQNVTITVAASPETIETLPIGSTQSTLGVCAVDGTPTGNCCSDTPATVSFSPQIPYGLLANGNPIGDFYITGSNQGYNCAPVNNLYFIGWTNYFNVLNAMLAAAKSQSVTVYELELEDEVNTMVFPVLLRNVYDNSLPQSAPSEYQVTVGFDTYANVLAGLRGQMTANGFDPGRVEYSAFWTDSSVATENCANAYDDYARNFGLDTITQAIIGGLIGYPSGYTITAGLTCGGSTSGMFQSPIDSTLPDIVDVHIYPEVTDTTNTGAMIQQVATIDYGDVPHFLSEASLESADIVIGETYGGTLSPLNLGTSSAPNYCWFGTYPSPSGTPSDNVAGFNASALASYTVTFRPWMQLQDPTGACFAYGSGAGSSGNYQSVNYNGEGPYTPTHP